MKDGPINFMMIANHHRCGTYYDREVVVINYVYSNSPSVKTKTTKNHDAADYYLAKIILSPSLTLSSYINRQCPQ